MLQIFKYTPRVRKLKRRNVIRVYTVVLHVVAYPKFETVEYLIHVSFHESKYTRYTVVSPIKQGDLVFYTLFS